MNMSPIKSKSKQKSRKNSKPTSNSRKRKMNRGNITKSNIPQKRQISDPVSTEKMLKSNAKHQKKNESAVLKKQLPDAKKQLNTNSDTTNYNTNEQLETDQQQMVVKLQTMLQQKNFELAQLNLQNLQLKTDIEVISKNNGNKHTELENKLKEQEATISQLTENLKQREAELETIMTNMKKVEERNMELTKQNLQLSTKIANTTKYIEALKDQHNRKIDMLNNQKLKLMGDVSHYQSNIVKLAEVNEQLKTANINASVIAQIQLDAAINESNELRKKLEELEEELHEVNVTALEAEVKEKVAYQAQLDQMTRQKNIIISQLTFKLNQITNLCILPVKSEKTAADQQENQSNTTQKIMSKLLLAVNSVGPNEDSDNNGTTSNPPCS